MRGILLFNRRSDVEQSSPPSQPKKERLPAYERVKNPPGIKLTQRDRELLTTLYHYDGMLSVDQIHRWFWPGRSKRKAQERISELFQNGYLRRPQRSELHRLPESIVLLDKKAMEVIAETLDLDFSEVRLRSELRVSRVAHDILLNEFRYTFTQALKEHPAYILEQWCGQDELVQLFPSALPYRDHAGQRREKLIRPDGYVHFFVKPNEATRGYRLRFLVELDNSTESNVRFGRDKVAPGVHFIHSPMYQEQLKAQSGRFMVIVAGSERKFHNLRSDIMAAGGSAFFICTRLDWVTSESALQQAIWYFPHLPTPFSLQQYGDPDFEQEIRSTFDTVPHVSILPSLF